jgi:putative DNA primase/helicase
MNTLPKNVELTDAFFRRFLIVPFNVRIPDSEQDPDLAKKIIDSEMSGVLNYVIEGMLSLIAEGQFDIPAIVRGTVNQFRHESDSVATFLDGKHCPSVKNWIPLREMHDSYVKQCEDAGNLAVSITVFGQRLRNLGYTVIKKGHAKQTVVFADTLITDVVDADCAVDAD